jgi:hypothetical protein
MRQRQDACDVVANVAVLAAKNRLWQPKKEGDGPKIGNFRTVEKHSFKNSTFCHYNCQYQGFAMHEGSLQSLSKKAILDLGTEKRDNFNSLQASTAVCQG